MNNSEPGKLKNTSTDSEELASYKQSKPLQPTDLSDQTIIRDYCQNLEDLLN